MFNRDEKLMLQRTRKWTGAQNMYNHSKYDPELHANEFHSVPCVDGKSVIQFNVVEMRSFPVFNVKKKNPLKMYK